MIHQDEEIKQLTQEDRSGPVVRRWRVLQVVAAVLVVAALLGGWLVVTRTHAPAFSRVVGTPAPAAAPSKDLYMVHHSVAYRINGRTGQPVWRFDFPPLLTPASANTAPGTSQPVLAP